jgi:hypothetical protein
MENKKILQATLLGAALALGGCAGDGAKSDSGDSMKSGAMSAEATAAGKSIAAAKAALETAEKTGFAWRDTGKMIKQAEGAAAKGDYAMAKKLADKAEAQSVLAAKQSKDQMNSGPNF